MAIRINRIKVNRGGPLEKDFYLEPGDVNLIYGHNETGKTYIVESIINLLFKTGKKSLVNWNLRDWDAAGNIIISGLQDRHVTFTKTSKKLDDYWEKGSGLPQDLSRLLVVKAGETLLAHEKDGVGRDILKNYLSGEGLLDRIEVKISTTLEKAIIQNGQIIGPNQGEIKTRDQLIFDLNSLDSLLKNAEESYSSGEVYHLLQEQKTIKSELEMLEKSKRHHASCLHEKRNTLQLKKDNFPSEEKLSKVESDISVYETNKSVVERKSDTLMKLESTAENYRWTEKALGVYREITGGRAIGAPKSLYMIFALIFLVGAVITGLFNLGIALAICAAVSLVFFILYYLGTRRAFATAGTSRELEKVKAEFKTRYGSDLTDRAVLEAQLDKLKEDYISARDLKGDLEESLIPDIRTRENNIRSTLLRFTGNELPPQQWRLSIRELRDKFIELGTRINSLDVELASLAVQSEDFLEQDPGIEWNRDRYNTLDAESTGTTETLTQALQKLEQLRTRIAQETHLDITDWEELITALRDRREKKAQEYRQITAKILAKIQVYTVIREFREEENTRIADGLESEELTKPLYEVTGRYKKIMHDVDRGIVLTTDKDEEYPLSEISTGAKEQTFLALRIGFSSIIMKGQTAFLILDDAFQHSDWPRRVNLMDLMLRLVESGWQVFYFTMDDHIRDLFLKAGEKLKDRFKNMELS